MAICSKIFVGWFFERHPEFSPSMEKIKETIEYAFSQVRYEFGFRFTDCGQILIEENSRTFDTDYEFTMTTTDGSNEIWPEASRAIHSFVKIHCPEFNLQLKYGLVHYFDCQ